MHQHIFIENIQTTQLYSMQGCQVELNYSYQASLSGSFLRKRINTYIQILSFYTYFIKGKWLLLNKVACSLQKGMCHIHPWILRVYNAKQRVDAQNFLWENTDSVICTLGFFSGSPNLLRAWRTGLVRTTLAFDWVTLTNVPFISSWMLNVSTSMYKMIQNVQNDGLLAPNLLHWGNTVYVIVCFFNLKKWYWKSIMSHIFTVEKVEQSWKLLLTLSFLVNTMNQH